MNRLFRQQCSIGGRKILLTRAAAAAAAAPGSAVLGGGTNLLDLMKGNVVRPDRLVDVTRLPGLDRIERLADGSTRVGALVRNGDRISVDVDAGTIELHVPAEELARRRAEAPRPLNPATGWLAQYRDEVRPMSRGATLGA